MGLRDVCSPRSVCGTTRHTLGDDLGDAPRRGRPSGPARPCSRPRPQQRTGRHTQRVESTHMPLAAPCHTQLGPPARHLLRGRPLAACAPCVPEPCASPALASCHGPSRVARRVRPPHGLPCPCERQPRQRSPREPTTLCCRPCLPPSVRCRHVSVASRPAAQEQWVSASGPSSGQQR